MTGKIYHGAVISLRRMKLMPDLWNLEKIRTIFRVGVVQPELFENSDIRLKTNRHLMIAFQ